MIPQEGSNLLMEIRATVPEDPSRVREARAGPHMTAVWLAGESGEAGACGLASTPPPHESDRDLPEMDLGQAVGRPAAELADWFLTERPYLSSIGLAAVNALQPPPPGALSAPQAMDLILARGRDERVAVVGHFPFVTRLREVAGELFVLELRMRPGDHPAEQAAEILPGCSLVVLTATVLLNGTFRQILPLCENAFTVMMGPSTPASPVLFDRGVDVLAGSMVTDPAGCLFQISTGVSYRQLTGVRKWTLIREAAL